MIDSEIPEYVLDWVADGCRQPEPHAVAEWLRAEPGRRAHLEAIGDIWRSSKPPLSPGAGIEDLRWRIRNEPPMREWRVAGLRAAAAIVLLATGLAGGWLASRGIGSSNREYTQITVPSASSTELKLPGDITVKLNAQSTLSYREGRNGVEEVRLDGEAYFDVRHDEDRTFVVHTAAGTVRDIGTMFNVRARDNEVSVVVSEGIVALEAEGRVVEVAAGRSARAARGQAPEAAVRADVLAALAWTSGRLVFIDRDLEDIAAELTRHFGKTVKVGQDIRGIRITAAVAASADAADAMQSIALAAGVRYAPTDTGWLFTSD